ncbi:MAG: GTPase domain-containing protein [Candidatus Marithrix sp.]|nr:GTPase domain-containing protein [Candidatus Marithrix sp.]
MTNKKNTYRLALYGLSGSGKTCLLAALAMQRDPHPLSHSCIWHPPEIPKLSKKTSQEYLLQKSSKDWLEDAINRLVNQEFPAPNPKGNEQFILEYDFTASTHQIFRVELIDYSGELINSPMDVNVLTKNLRRRFAEVDGIIVFAEIPPPNVDNSEDLFKLQQTFSLLLREAKVNIALDTPVALLVTKWDRYSDIDHSNPDNERAKLETFINATPSHRRLVDTLRFSTTEGNFKAFPVSALGTCEKESTIKTGAFGLEDPFIWIAQQRNDIDLQQFKEQVKSNSNKCGKTGNTLLGRFPKNSTQIKQIQILLQKCRQKIFTHIIYGVMAGIILSFVVETSVDIMDYRQHIVIASLPHTTDKQLDEAEDWLIDYVASPHFRHSLTKIFFNNSEANLYLTKLQTQREKWLWEPVIKVSKDLMMAADLASKYLLRYPRGKHAQQARDIKLNVEILQNRQANSDALRNNQFIAKNNWYDFNRISDTLNKLHGLPLHPKAETDEQRQERISWEENLTIQLVELTEQQNWLKFLIIYEKRLQAKQFLVAAQSLINHHSTNNLEELKVSFKEVVVQELEELVEQALKNNEALAETEFLLREYTRFAPQLQTDYGKKTIALLRYKIHERIDEELYNEVVKNHNLKYIQRYLQEAPLRNMRHEVINYKNYLSQIDPSNMLRLRLKLTKITWINVNDKNNIVSVFLNGKQAIYNDQVDANYGSTTTGIVGISSIFSAKPNHPITIAINVTNEDLFFNDDYGHAMMELTVSELAEPILGYPLILRTDENRGQKTGTAFFELEGFPREPLLPPWRSN